MLALFLWVSVYLLIGVMLLSSCYGVRSALVRGALNAVFAPIALSFRLLKVDVRSVRRWIFRHIQYGVAVFYYLLFCGSVVSLLGDSFFNQTIRVPHIDVEHQMVLWRAGEHRTPLLGHFPALVGLLQIALHCASVWSFTRALLGPRGNKNCPAYRDFDNILYIAQKCDTCQHDQQPRATHCGYCGTCLQRRDHHCIWLNYCVYAGNVGWFNAFLSSTAWACALKLCYDWRCVRALYCGMESYNLQICKLDQLIDFPLRSKLSWLISTAPIAFSSFALHSVIALTLVPFSLFHLRNYARNLTQDERYFIQQLQRQIRCNPSVNLYCLAYNYARRDFFCYLNSSRAGKAPAPVLLMFDCEDERCGLAGRYYCKMSKKDAVRVLGRYSPYAKRQPHSF